jgi:membrane fusion protein, multidrug efflux system
VHKGDIVAAIDPRPFKAVLDQATARRDEDAAILRSATLELQRFVEDTMNSATSSALSGHS